LKAESTLERLYEEKYTPKFIVDRLTLSCNKLVTAEQRVDSPTMKVIPFPRIKQGADRTENEIWSHEERDSINYLWLPDDMVDHIFQGGSLLTEAISVHGLWLLDVFSKVN
jgi:hypothetical protein